MEGLNPSININQNSFQSMSGNRKKYGPKIVKCEKDDLYEREHSVQDFQKRSIANSEALESFYPFSFEDLAADLKEGHSFGERYNREYVASCIIAKELLLMGEDGFDFYFKGDCEHNDRGRTARRFIRRVDLHFECPNKVCPIFRRQDRNKAWTSYYGLAFITYKFENLENNPSLKGRKRVDSQKFPYVLKYNIKLYGQICQECSEMGKAFIFESQIDLLAKMFCCIVAKILETEDDPVNRPKKHRHENDVEFKERPWDKKVRQEHPSDKCEACIEGYCKNLSSHQFRQKKAPPKYDFKKKKNRHQND